MVIALWSVMLAIAWISGSRVLRFAGSFLILSTLPVAFIPPRGVPQYYIPLFGWALYAAALLDLGLGVVFRMPQDIAATASFSATALRKERHREFRHRTFAGAALVVLIAAVAYGPWRAAQKWHPDTVLVEAEVNRSVVGQLHRLEPRLPHRARLMFLDDPIPSDRWNMTFMVHLSYNDRSIEVERMKALVTGTDTTANPGVKTPDLAAYDHVFDYRGGHFIEIARPWRRVMTPLIVIDGGRPQIFHSDGTLVTREDPAERDEDLYLKTMDLGATVPEIPAGDPFPGEPFARVIAKIEVRVNGAPVTVGVKIGWQGTRDYRVDIHAPPAMSRGLSWMQISADGVAGPPVEFPVY